MRSTVNMQKKEPDSLITTVKNKVVYSFRLTMFLLLKFAYYVLYEYGLLSKPPPPTTISSLSDDYIQHHKSVFLNSYENINADHSMNIEKCFYDSKLHALAVENAENELEQIWRRRIMLENTPRGNIIMYYDAFKQGFVYYSDNSNIPYFVLNAAVMKYVLLFKCRDFFIDDQITPENTLSPLLSIYHKPEPPKNTDNQSIKMVENPVLKSTAFAKLKTYNTVSGKLSSNDTEKPVGDKSSDILPEKKEKDYTRNKIIYSGKMSNFNLLQHPKVAKHVSFSSDLLDGLKTTIATNSDTNNRVFNYRDFKKLQEQQSSQQ